MHGMRKVRLVTDTGEKIVEYAAVAHPAVGERVQYKDNFFAVFGVLHKLDVQRDGGGSYTNLDVVIIEVTQELPY